MRVSPLGLVTTQRSSVVVEGVRGVHPVQRLVGADVGVDGHAAVGLDHDQPDRRRQRGRQAAVVGGRAAGDEDAHRAATVVHDTVATIARHHRGPLPPRVAASPCLPKVLPWRSRSASSGCPTSASRRCSTPCRRPARRPPTSRSAPSTRTSASSPVPDPRLDRLAEISALGEDRPHGDRVRRHRRPGRRRQQGRGPGQPVPRPHPRGRRRLPRGALLRGRRRRPRGRRGRPGARHRGHRDRAGAQGPRDASRSGSNGPSARPSPATRPCSPRRDLVAAAARPPRGRGPGPHLRLGRRRQHAAAPGAVPADRQAGAVRRQRRRGRPARRQRPRRRGPRDRRRARAPRSW